jgi:HEPN domain-containing protein
MPHDPVKVKDTREWLQKAWEDLQVGRTSLLHLPDLTSPVVFHAQQAVEKALKAFLYWHDVPFRKTHVLEELGRQIIEVDSSLSELMGRAHGLTKYAWQFRYPHEGGNPTFEEAESALAVATEVF